MEQQRVIRNSIAIFLLTIISVQYVLSLSQNFNNTTNNIDSINDNQVVHYTIQPLNTTTSIYQDSATYSPVLKNISKNADIESLETKSPDQYVQSSDHHEVYISDNDDDDSTELEDHTIVYSEHEKARNVPTRPKYIAPGNWAKPPPDKKIPLDFVPSKLHAQVRGIHTVKRLPRREAIRDAKNDEERRNAPRLKAIVTNSKINTVYTEEGYEDSAYDHAGHIRDADFHEGHARKLHDRKNSRKSIDKGKNEHLVPKEFQEYDNDYQDYHSKKNSKLEESSDSENNFIDSRNVWEGIDPKLVAENGIEKLKKDTENDAEETERNSIIYRNKQESRINNDIKNDSSESEETNNHEDSSTDEGNESTVTKRKKPSNRKDSVNKERVKQAIKNRKQKRHRTNYEPTTLIPFNDTANSAAKVEIFTDHADFVTDSQTSTTPFYQTDYPTTISYGQIFWNYFKKTKQSPSSIESTFTPDPLTLNSQSNEQIPITMINSSDAYFLAGRETSTILPSTFLDSTRNFHPQKLFPDTVELDAGTTHRQNRRLLGQSESVNYIGDNPLATSTFSATSIEPHLLRSSQLLNTENTEYPSSTISLDDIVSNTTPAIVTINITNEAYSRMPDYLINPFFSSMLDNSNIVINRNKFKYKVLVRPKSKKFNKSAIHNKQNTLLSMKAVEEEGNNERIHDKSNIKQDYIGNTKPPEIRLFVEDKELITEEDLTRMRPPIPQQILYPFFSTDRPPAINYSSMSIESESPQLITELRKSLLRNQHRFQSTKSPSRFNSLTIVQPTYHTNLLPTTKLLPPSPFANTHAEYPNKYNNYVSYLVSGKPQKHYNVFKYQPLSPAVNWRTRSRRKRSDKIDEFHNMDPNDKLNVKAARNNNVPNDSVSEQGDRDLFNRTVRRTKRKSWSQGIIDVSSDSDVPDTIKLTTAGSVISENSTVSINGRNRSVTNGESKNAETRDTQETVTDNVKSIKRGPVLFQSEIQHRYDINTSAEEQDQEEKRNVTRKLNRRGHEELLNESPKISGDVIEKEIAVRFNESNSNDKTNNKTATSTSEEKVEVDVPSFDYADELAENDHVESSVTTTKISSVDTKKYPFYNNADLPSASALRYVVDPKTIPRKTSHGMEFYDSRNAYKHCDEIDHNLDEILPKKEEPNPDRGLQEDLPRLRGLGDKLDCFKAKYFDENPFDNPLFAEKVVEEPTRPPELNPTHFASKIMLFPKEKDEYVVHRISRRPERNGRQWRNRNRDYETHESIRINYKHDPLTGRGRNAYLHSVRSTLPFNIPRRGMKNRRVKLKITTTTPQSPKSYQTASYQNQVYEDVMGNIRNMAKAYQVYEITTLPPSTQNLATAGSEITLKVSSVTPSLQQEKDESLLNVTDSTTNTELSEIKGLLPPKYSTPKRVSYRKHRPEANNRITLLNLPQIIAHYHSIKMNKRSITMDTETNFSVNNEDKKDEIEESKGTDNIGNIVTTTSMEIDTIGTIGNDTIEEPLEDISRKANASIIRASDLMIGESRRINKQKQNLSATLKHDDEIRGRNSTSHDWNTESPERTIYTIRDRIRYSKPKLDAKGFGNFDTSLKSVDEDSRRKEPRYNYLKTRKLTANMQNNSINSDISGIESTTIPIRIQENSKTELCDSKKCQFVFGRKNQYSEPDKAESVIYADDTEDESETTPNVYRVHEDVDEDVTTTTTGLINSFSSKEAQNLRDYLKSDPPGYAETFSEEATTLSSPYATAVNQKSEDKENEEDEQEDEQINYREKNPLNDDSFEKVEEQMEIPINTQLSPHDENFERPVSEEKTTSSEDQTFYEHTKRPLSSTESERDDERSEKTVFYRPFKFSKYKSKEESDEDESEEESKEKSEDRVFPWHADKEDKRKGSQDFYNYEYPWEKRERLAKERRRKRKKGNRYKKFSFDNDDEEEEEEEKSSTSEKPIYPWERYNVPPKNHVNNRHNISHTETDEESKEIIKLPAMKFSSRYSSDDVKSSPKQPSSALEVSRSIKKFLEDEPDDKSEEESSEEIEDRPSSSVRRSSSSNRKGISRRTLVPDDITEPPSRKTRVSKIDNDDLRVSRFDSKKLKDRDIDREEEEGNEMEVSTIKSDANNMDNAKLGASDRLNRAKKVSHVTGQHKKRRRIYNNNTTIPHDNAATESVTKSIKKKRRNTRVIMSTTPSTNDDLDTGKSAFIPVRKRYSKTDNIVKRNELNSSGKTLNKTIDDIEDIEMETSTPKIRTIEHRSRVSEEKLVTKTTYPDKVENFDFTNKDFNSDLNDQMNKQNAYNRKGKVMYSDVKNVKRLRKPRKPDGKNKDGSLKNINSKNTRFEKTSSVDSFDRISDSDDGELKRMTSSETYIFNNLLRSIPNNPVRSNRANERNKNKFNRTIGQSKKVVKRAEKNDGKEGEKLKKRRKSLLQPSFIKDPERRLYYYVESK